MKDVTNPRDGSVECQDRGCGFAAQLLKRAPDGVRMPTTSDELRDRTKRFAFAVVNLVKVMPQNIATDGVQGS